MFSERVFEGQTAFITGGASGIGLGIARELGQAGARVFLASRNTERLDAAVAELTAEGIEADRGQLDVREPDQVAAAVAAAVTRFGQVDILVNNAAGNFVCPAEDLTPNGWRAVVGIVLDGSFYCSREVGRHMIEAGHGGSIVSILATYAWTGGPGVIHSACAKAGVKAMTQTLAVEWARHGIRVNAVAPGAIPTEGATKQLWDSEEAKKKIGDLIPLGRWGTVQECARVVAFLCSPYASYVSGDTITMDGAEWLGKGLQGLTQSVLQK